MYAAMYTFAAKKDLYAAHESMSSVDEIVQRLLVVVPTLVFVGLGIWTIKLIHQRKNDAIFAVIMLTIASYGLFSFGEVDGGVANIQATIASITITAIDLAIAAYVLKAKQVKKVLSK